MVNIMKLIQLIKASAFSLALTGMAVSPLATVQAASPVTKSNVQAVVDVSLAANGDLTGQVVNPQGTPQAAKHVQILDNQGRAVQVTTDANGRFSAPLKSGGVFMATLDGNATTFRAWQSHTAPPNAGHGMLLVTPDTAVRGAQCNSCNGGGCNTCCPRKFGGFGKSKMIFYGILGAAAAVALGDLDDAS